MNEDELVEYLTEEFPNASENAIRTFAANSAARGQSEELLRGAFVAFNETWSRDDEETAEQARRQGLPWNEIDQYIEREIGRPLRKEIDELLGVFDREPSVDATMTDRVTGVWTPTVNPVTHELIDPRFIRIPGFGVMRIEEYLTRSFMGDPLVEAHEALLSAAASSVPAGVNNPALVQQQQIARATMDFYTQVQMEADPQQLARDFAAYQQIQANPQYAGFEGNIPNPYDLVSQDRLAGQPAGYDNILTNEFDADIVTDAGDDTDMTGRISQLPEVANPEVEMTPEMSRLVHGQRYNHSYAWGSMTPGRMQQWYQTQDREVQTRVQMLLDAMGMAPEGLGAELGAGWGPQTNAALLQFGQNMFANRDTHTMSDVIRENLNQTFNASLADTVNSIIEENLPSMTDAAIQSVVTISTTKPEDMEDQLREIVGMEFGMRQALSQDQVDSIIGQGLARERESALLASDEYQTLIRARDQQQRQTDLNEASTQAFLDAQFTGFGQGHQQYAGMTKGMFDSIATQIGIDPENYTAADVDTIAKVWAKNIMNSVGGNLNMAFERANLYAYQGRGEGEQLDQSGGLRAANPNIPAQPAMDPTDTLEQHRKFNDSFEAYTGLTVQDVINGNLGGDDTSGPIVVNAPRFDMVRYLRRAAINTNPQQFAKQDMRNKMRTWINDLIMAESPARVR